LADIKYILQEDPNAEIAALHHASVLLAMANTAALALVALALCTPTYCWSYESLVKLFGV